MNFALYQAMKDELNLRSENKTGKLANISIEQLKQLITTYEAEIFQYMMNQTVNYISKLERCGV